MIDRLRSHLKSEKGFTLMNKFVKSNKGFTLIELLVVIAIIAILVVIVVVAINPVERLREASDRRAQSNVRSAGTLISTCVTKELSLTPPGALLGCIPGGTLGTYGNVPANVDIEVDNGGADDICATQEGRAGTYFTFRHSRGDTQPTVATYPAAGARC